MQTAQAAVLPAQDIDRTARQARRLHEILAPLIQDAYRRAAKYGHPYHTYVLYHAEKKQFRIILKHGHGWPRLASNSEYVIYGPIGHCRIFDMMDVQGHASGPLIVRPFHYGTQDIPGKPISMKSAKNLGARKPTKCRLVDSKEAAEWQLNRPQFADWVHEAALEYYELASKRAAGLP